MTKFKMITTLSLIIRRAVNICITTLRDTAMAENCQCWGFSSLSIAHTFAAHRANGALIIEIINN